MPLCHVDELTDPGAKGFDPGGEGQDAFFIVRHGQVVHGWRNDCPHVPGGAMAWRRDAYLDASGRHIQCSAHGALFDPASGECIAGPCLGRHLVPVALRVGDDGQVALADPAPLPETAQGDKT